MSTNRNNEEQNDNRVCSWQNLALSAELASNQQQPACEQGQNRSQLEQREQLQSIQRQDQLQLVQRSLPHLQSRQGEPQQQQEKHKQQKKKCRGDRKRQRYRAKLRKRGLNDEEIANLEHNYSNINHGQEIQLSTIPDVDIELLVPTDKQKDMPENENVQQTKSVKRKRETRPVGITTSLSQMSISNLSKKRPRSTSMRRITEEKSVEETQSNNKPKYLKVPDQVFKDMLSKSLTDGNSIVEALDTPEKLEFVQHDFWQHYHTVCISEVIWSSPLTKDIAKENNLCRFKFKTKIQLEKHTKIIGTRLQEAENNLNSHQQQPINSSFDMNKLSTIITAFVRQGQHKLSAEYERKKLILQCDANDHRLIKAFYNLNPTENQIRSAKIIWQATKDKLQVEEQVAVLKQRIYTKRLPASFAILDHSIDNMENMLKQPALNQDKRATLSFRRLKTIAQFKYDMMVLAITTTEETVRCHASIIADEKKKLIDTTGGQVPIPKSLV
ncbi:unnamed protein product, partial [Rotaria sordida]